MAASKIMLIRHAEKPATDGSNVGVDEFGEASARSLSVRGWQRAGALVQFFMSPSQGPAAGIASPDVIFAASATDAEDSLRPSQTALPLARLLGLKLRTDFRKNQTAALATALTTEVDGTALVSWEHKAMPALAAALLGRAGISPAVWPDDRFDVVWVFDRMGNDGYSFSQVAQMLLGGDMAEPLAKSARP